MALQHHIHTFEDMGARYADGTSMTFHESLKEWWRRLHPGRAMPERPAGVLPQYDARINWGRWIVDCPNCNAALDATPTETIALCVECEAEWFEIIFPPLTRRNSIERALLKRPGNRAGTVFGHSNWYPGESIASLERENQRMGIS